MALKKSSKRKAPDPGHPFQTTKTTRRPSLAQALKAGVTVRRRSGKIRKVAPVPWTPNALEYDLAAKPLFDVFVFGTGSMGELGLGPQEENRTVKRPRLHAVLAKEDVVDVAVGGMHTAVLLQSGQVWTWGVNDQGALGRNTAWHGLPSVSASPANGDSDDDSQADLINPFESTPSAIHHAQTFIKIAASDSLTAAIDDCGHLFAWGTFRCSDGLLGFDADSETVLRPQRIPHKERFTDLACGTDHVLALSATGLVYAWGNGEQYQLGRRVLPRLRLLALVPRKLALKHIVAIGSGAYHSFAVDKDGRLFAWGLNQFGQCGVTTDDLGEDGAVVKAPTLVEALAGVPVKQVTGGEHHSAAVCKNGSLYVWGRLDLGQLGLKRDALPATAVNDKAGKPRYLPDPTRVSFKTTRKAASIACGAHHNVLIDAEGDAWSWGFGELYQVGQGPPGEDVALPTLIRNTATEGRQMVLAGAGGQFSVLAALRK